MIKKFSCRHFKSLDDVRVTLDPVTVLIGRSGTGKSNFVDAIQFLRDYLIHRTFNFVPSYGGWEAVLSATAAERMPIAFLVAFDVPGISEEFQYCLVLDQHPEVQPRETIVPVIQNESLYLGGRPLFHQEGPFGKMNWRHPPAVVQPPIPGNLMLGGLTGIYEVSVAYLALTVGVGCYSFLDSVLTPIGQPGAPPQPAFPVQVVKPGDTGLLDNGSNYLQALVGITTNLHAWAHLKEMVAAMRRLDPSLQSIDLAMPERDKVVVSHAVSNRILPLPLNLESEGFRRFLAHLIALYQTPSKQTLIFEEAEKGIHPGALAVLADQFKACPGARRGQVILTTHSPELLDHFPPENLRVVEIRDYLTQIGPLDPGQVEAVREQLLRPGELLTVEDARLAPDPSTGC
jgi:predicted ATPase